VQNDQEIISCHNQQQFMQIRSVVVQKLSAIQLNKKNS